MHIRSGSRPMVQSLPPCRCQFYDGPQRGGPERAPPRIDSDREPRTAIRFSRVHSIKEFAVRTLTLTAIGTVLALGACNRTDTATTNADEVAVTNDTASNIADTGTTGAVDAAFVTEAMQGDNAEV